MVNHNLHRIFYANLSSFAQVDQWIDRTPPKCVVVGSIPTLGACRRSLNG